MSKNKSQRGTQRCEIPIDTIDDINRLSAQSLGLSEVLFASRGDCSQQSLTDAFWLLSDVNHELRSAIRAITREGGTQSDKA